MIDMIEEWKPIIIDNIKNDYLISTFGRVYNSLTNKFLSPCENHNGYLHVGLYTYDGKRVTRRIHRLVMLTFCYFPGCEKLQVNHKDTNKHNNHITNLEWATPLENTRHAIINNCRSSVGENNPKATITNNDAYKIYEMVIDGKSDSYIANCIGCSIGVVRELCLGRTWTHLFTEKQLNDMKKTRIGYTISEKEKESLCLYYQNNSQKYNTNYGKAKDITINALLYNNIPVNDTTIRIARRLFFRIQNHEITNKYIY